MHVRRRCGRCLHAARCVSNHESRLFSCYNYTRGAATGSGGGPPAVMHTPHRITQRSCRRRLGQPERSEVEGRDGGVAACCPGRAHACMGRYACRSHDNVCGASARDGGKLRREGVQEGRTGLAHTARRSVHSTGLRDMRWLAARHACGNRCAWSRARSSGSRAEGAGRRRQPAHVA